MKLTYETKGMKPISTQRFAIRLFWHFVLTMGLISVSLLMGMAGYHYYEGMSTTDAFLNAAMILGGMGPVKTEGLSEAGKIFAGSYALYCGLAFIAAIGIVLAPVVHRILHRFHWDVDEEK